jgi:hypothetical protein
MAKRGRPRTRPEPIEPETMVYECIDRRGDGRQFEMSSELTADEAMQRIGVYRRPFTVTRWSKAKPDDKRVVQRLEQ